MKIKIEKPQSTKWKFPCLGKSKSHGIVVYFHSDESGVVVEQSSKYPYLYRSRVFDMRDFEPLNSPTEEGKTPLKVGDFVGRWFEHSDGASKVNEITGCTIFVGVVRPDREVKSTELKFASIGFRDEWLARQNWLQKGSKITLEL
jgi:hypothetical protein